MAEQKKSTTTSPRTRGTASTATAGTTTRARAPRAATGTAAGTKPKATKPKTAAKKPSTRAAAGTATKPKSTTTARGTAPKSATPARGRASSGRGGGNLVIVESPTKARTLAGFLGTGYDVRASVGHVRDLPKSKMGVDVDRNFAPQYIVPREKSSLVKDLKAAAQKANVVYLATDPDREGEAISWHLVEAMGLKDRAPRRVEFHEITRDAIRDAFEHPRELDTHLVDAQQARRVLDRLVGYKISPLLWKKVRRGLSAGRVQSPALRMVVEREREIQNFQAREYWTLDAELLKERFPNHPFRARLLGYANDRKRELEIPNTDEAERLRGVLQSSAFTVTEVKERPQHRKPAPPFTTSTLQQEASRRLGFTAKRTMAVAQQLYEGREVGPEGSVGLITYMRTDSTNVSAQAVQATRELIGRRFGGDFVPGSARVYTKKAKGAQEAHEAIRPSDVMREPEALRRFLTPDQQKLYLLIWQRMIASQMADAIIDTTSVDIEAAPKEGLDKYVLRATASKVRFPGFRAVYFESNDEERDEDADTRTLPELTAGDPLRLLDVLPEQHFTQPPPRYTEASLVKALEENGIGRPSTYAATISTLVDRDYVEKNGRQLIPKELGFLVTDLLTEHFRDFVDIGFTAGMEEDLDDIAAGERPWQPVVEEYYRPLESAVEKAADIVEPVTEETDAVCHECEAPMKVRWGRFGKFLACSRYPDCKGSRPIDGTGEPEIVPDEKCPECSGEMQIKMGRFGRFLACTRYPDCKGAKPLLQKIGVDCPECGGAMVQRKMRGKGGRVFYGCSNYPTCNFTTWQRPLSEPCPLCGKLVVQEGKDGAKCTACAWRTDHEPAVASA